MRNPWVLFFNRFPIERLKSNTWAIRTASPAHQVPHLHNPGSCFATAFPSNASKTRPRLSKHHSPPTKSHTCTTPGPVFESLSHRTPQNQDPGRQNIIPRPPSHTPAQPRVLFLNRFPVERLEKKTRAVKTSPAHPVPVLFEDSVQTIILQWLLCLWLWPWLWV